MKTEGEGLMLMWILAVFGLYVFNLLLVAYLRFGESDLPTDEKVRIGLGPRDSAPELGIMGARADKALNNLKESLPIFITFALLSIVFGKENPQAIQRATIFTVARFAYLPSYLWGVPGLRSIVWGIAVAGLVMMLISLF